MRRAFFALLPLLAPACDSGAGAPPAMQLTGTATANASAEQSEPVPVDSGPPPVELDGTSHPAAVTLVDATAGRVFSRAMRTWIAEKPERDSPRLGYLRAGGSAPLSGEKVSGSGCKGGYVPIKPRGYVCLDGAATLDGDDPLVAMMEEHPPDFGRKLPYIYGTVRNPGPIYGRLPNPEELKEAEPDIEDRMPRWLDAGGEIGASYAQHVWTPGAEPTDPRKAWEARLEEGVPDPLQGGTALPQFLGKRRDGEAFRVGMMRPKIGFSILETFLWQGRRYGITTELDLVPTDRLRPIQGSDFHGYEIGKDVKFPFALVRSPIAKFKDGKKAPYRAALQLTGQQLFFDGVLHYETVDGAWIADRFASRMDPPKNMPGWGNDGEKWIDISLTKQTMTLYEGTDPVFVTLVSTGEAGLEDPEHTTATKRGIFRIHTKHVTATMSSAEIGEEFELQDVPYVQYFDKEGYAIHGAYWHDRFGVPKSHGCINLAPEDARRLFHWTDPQVPVGWHGALLPLRGTVVFIHP